MLKYVLKRIFLAIVTLIIIIAITFILLNLIPGGPFVSDKALTPEVKETLTKRFNLDKPLIIQFLLYLKNIIHGDFGISMKTQRNVADIIFSSFAISAKIGFFAILIALAVGVVLGVICALYKNTFIERLIVVLSTFTISIPSFVIACFLLYLFCVKFQIFPVWSPTNQHIVLPIIAMSFSPIAVIIKYMRSSMLETLGENYVKTARAKGVSEYKVLFVHALRNAIIPIITYIGPLTAGMITGSVVVEEIFSVGGLGLEFLRCINNNDYPLVLGITIFFSFIIVVTNLISDILYKIVDPRIKFYE